jgi:mono/diheme cytochrome c family protein
MKLATAIRSAAHIALIAAFALIALAAATWSGVSPATALAASTARGSDAPAERAARGKTMFRVYCASCHGQAAAGDGPVSQYLNVPVPDLRTLASANDGEFPAERVYRLIDGRDEILVHGAREMPVWGHTFQDRDRDNDQEQEVAERIRDLVAFVQSIQE